jgi:hypothetical protein
MFGVRDGRATIASARYPEAGAINSISNSRIDWFVDARPWEHVNGLHATSEAGDNQTQHEHYSDWGRSGVDACN